MSLVWRLALANVRRHPARMVLTSLAVIAAACVVIWVVSGYDALLAQMDSFADEYLGRYQLVVASDRPERVGQSAGPPISPKVVSLLREDGAILALDPLMQSPVKKAMRVPSKDRPHPRNHGAASATPSTARPFSWPRPTLVGTNADKPPHEMVKGAWIDPSAADRDEVVLSTTAARRLQADVGDTIVVETDAGEFQLAIIGIVEQASMGGDGARGSSPTRGPATDALHVPIALAEKISGKPAEISCIQIALREGEDAASFRRRWNERLAREGYHASVFDPNDVKDEMREGMSAARVRSQAYAATGISLLAALFIILTTLSMGVHERIRQFAMLRAVALTRGQIASMIALESLVLAVIGWLGGLAAGWGLLRVAAAVQPSLFANGATIGAWAIVLSGLCAFGGALLASVPPAWRATRVNPLEAMTPSPPAPSARGWFIAGLVGLILIAVNPLLVFVVPMADESRWGVYAAVGCACMALGFLLLAPLTIVVAEKLFAPALAFVFRLDARLLGTQLSSNLWRTLGTTVALSLGLGLFVAMQTWGYSMLAPFVPGDWAPDALVCFPRGGLPDGELNHVAQLRGIDSRRFLPLAIEQPKLAEDITGSQDRTSVARQDNVIMIGLDPDLAFGGDDPMFHPRLVKGDREAAIQGLKQGRGCLVPDHFVETTGLGVGDRFSVVPPESPDRVVDYTISGVVSLPGWHWMTKFSGLRRRSGRSAAMVFVSRENARRDFSLDKTNFIWFDAQQGANLDDIGKELSPIADRHAGELQPVNAQGTWENAARMFGPTVRLTTAEDIRARINARADTMIWAMSRLPLVTLLVTSLGVVNAIMASVRSRRWEMGVLRAIGLTRFGLMRMILAEALLIGLVACLLSLGFGVTAGWCGAGISQYVSFFGGQATPLVVPWTKIALGFGAALGLCLLAALWPAISTGRREPLQLLGESRAAL